MVLPEKLTAWKVTFTTVLVVFVVHAINSLQKRSVAVQWGKKGHFTFPLLFQMPYVRAYDEPQFVKNKKGQLLSKKFSKNKVAQKVVPEKRDTEEEILRKKNMWNDGEEVTETSDNMWHSGVIRTVFRIWMFSWKHWKEKLIDFATEGRGRQMWTMRWVDTNIEP